MMKLLPPRMVVALAVFMAAVTTVVLSTALPAHGESADRLEVLEVDVSRHPQVSLVVKTPAALLGRAVDAGAFEVIDGDRAVDVAVEPISTDGLEVVLVLDTSGSMKGEPIAAARSAAATFIRSLPAGTPVSIIGFGATPSVAAPFTTDVDALVGAVGRLEASGETALNDALARAATELVTRPAGRRAVVVLSDGGDTVSTSSLDAAIAKVADVDATVHVVELLSAETDHDALEQITRAADGMLVGATDPAALEAAYREVTADLVSRYRLSYTTELGGPTSVEIRLAAGDVRSATVSKIVYPGAAARSLSAPSASELADPGLLGSGPALAVGAVCMFAAIAAIAATLMRPGRRKVALASFGGETSTTSSSGIRDLATTATAIAERTLAKHDRTGALDTLLEHAGILLRPAELIVMVAVGSFAAAAVGLLLGGLLFAIVLAALVPGIALLLITAKRDRRRKAFGDQLDDLLALVASSLRAGYGLQQALESASTELESPAADELRRLTTEVRLGRDLGDCLEAMAVRVGNEDFGWVAQAIRIHREVGGDLSEVLDRVSETIRARNHVRRQVRALSAEGRMSAYILFALPLGVALLMSVTNRDYLAELFTTGMGLAMTGGAVVLMTAGGLWLRKLVRIVY